VFDNQKEQKEYDNEDIAFGCTILLVFGILGFITSFILIFSYPLASITIVIISVTLIIASILMRINNSVKEQRKHKICFYIYLNEIN